MLGPRIRDTLRVGGTGPCRFRRRGANLGKGVGDGVVGGEDDDGDEEEDGEEDDDSSELKEDGEAVPVGLSLYFPSICCRPMGSGQRIDSNWTFEAIESVRRDSELRERCRMPMPLLSEQQPSAASHLFDSEYRLDSTDSSLRAEGSKTYSGRGGLLVAGLASHLEGNAIGSGVLELEGGGREVVEVLVEEL